MRNFISTLFKIKQNEKSPRNSKKVMTLGQEMKPLIDNIQQITETAQNLGILEVEASKGLTEVCNKNYIIHTTLPNFSVGE